MLDPRCLSPAPQHLTDLGSAAVSAVSAAGQRVPQSRGKLLVNGPDEPPRPVRASLGACLRAECAADRRGEPGSAGVTPGQRGRRRTGERLTARWAADASGTTVTTFSAAGWLFLGGSDSSDVVRFSESHVTAPVSVFGFAPQSPRHVT